MNIVELWPLFLNKTLYSRVTPFLSPAHICMHVSTSVAQNHPFTSWPLCVTYYFKAMYIWSLDLPSMQERKKSEVSGRNQHSQILIPSCKATVGHSIKFRATGILLGVSWLYSWSHWKWLCCICVYQGHNMKKVIISTVWILILLYREEEMPEAVLSLENRRSSSNILILYVARS